MIISITNCDPKEFGKPMNIRTESSNLIVDDYWASSHSYGDGGSFIHQVLLFSFKLNQNIPQNLHYFNQIMQNYYYFFDK
jgi:hypothetical protein